jgi:hydrogenase maturation factor
LLTTDAFIVDPIFFPGGDIGKIAVCGTINDLAVMGAKPLGISLSILLEEGFPKADFLKIIKSIAKVSKEAGVPIVTGDTKVTEKGKLDKIGQAMIDKVSISDKTWYRVRLGPFNDKSAADAALEKVHAAGAPDARITRKI